MRNGPELPKEAAEGTGPWALGGRDRGEQNQGRKEGGTELSQLSPHRL